MSEKPLLIRLEVTDQRSGQYLLSFDSSHYSVQLQPEASVTFNEWLRRLRPVLTGYNDPGGDIDPQDLLHNIGVWLWKALLPESSPVRERAVLSHALRTGHTPLLLSLPDMLAELPWELLYDPEQSDDRGFLARHRPLIRLSAKAPAMIPIEPPLRVLLLVSSPPVLGEDSRVDVESERAAVEQAVHEMRERGFLHLVVEDIVTPKRVELLLDRFKPHIVHYIGHGQYDQTNGGMLLWEDDQGNALHLSTSHVASLLRSRNLHAVVLHGCETARSNARAEMLGLAGTLAQEGVPAILAQQANLTYKSSQLASQAWYKALTTGQSMAFALLAVRQGLIEADRPDWSVPILQGSTVCLAPVLSVTALAGIADPLLTRVGAAADLPTPTDVFVGRHRELRALHLILEDTSDDAPTLALITGPGGIGKSTLAIQAVTRYGGAYKAALMLHCQEYQSIDLFLQSIGEFLKRLGAPDLLERTLPDPKLSAEAKMDEAIVALNGVGPVLLIIDNLESIQNEDHMISDKALLYLLQSLLTNLHSGKVLITGRYMVKELLMQEELENKFLHLSLDDLSPYETSQLLLRYPPLARLSEIVRQMLVREFGGLPYVYHLLSSKAAVEELEQIIYEVREYGAVKQKTITEERKHRTAEEWRKVHSEIVKVATLEVIISRLSQDSRTLLGQLGVLHQPFPLAAIEEGLKAERPSWQPLLDWSLLHYDPLEQTYRLHSITRHYAESLLDDQSCTQAQAQLASWYEHYADRESHVLTDYLEAYRLWRVAGLVQQAGKLIMQLAIVMIRFGLFSLLCELCMTTLHDIRESDRLLTAQLLNQLGIIAFSQGDHSKAQQFYKQSLYICERLDNQQGQAAILHQLGLIAQRQGDYQEAQQFYKQSLEIKDWLGDQQGRASTLHQLGAIAQEQGNSPEAQRLFLQSLDIFERLDDQQGRATILHQLGGIAQGQGNYLEARRLYEQSLDIDEQLGDQQGRATNRRQLGVIAFLQGDYLEAQRLFLQCLGIFERLGDQYGRAVTLHHLGILAQEQGNSPEAQQFYKQSLEIKDWLGDQQGRASTLHHLGMIAQKQGDYPETQRLFLQSLDILERLDNQDERAGLLYRLGVVAQKQGDYLEARKFYERSLDIFEQLGNQGWQATILHQLGMIVQEQGGYPEAWKFYEQSLEIKERLGNQQAQATTLHQLGILAQKQGNSLEAWQFYEQSLDIFERLGDQIGRATSLHQLGFLVYNQGNYERALTYEVQALILFDSLHSPYRDVVQRLITAIRSHMDEAMFTTLWQTITDGHSLSIPSDEETNRRLLKVVIDFIQVPTPGESKHFLESHPELLQSEVDTILRTLASQQEQEDVRKAIEQHRLLLAECRDKGIAVAFAEHLHEPNLERTFADELNRLCNEVVTTRRSRNTAQHEALAIRLERMLQDNIPVEGALDFLQVLIAWLRGQDTHATEALLQPSFRAAYAQMVTAIEQEEMEKTEENDVQRVEDLPGFVSSAILQGTTEQRLQLAKRFVEVQQKLPSEAAALGRFFGCLVAALRGKAPDLALLAAPFTKLWQEFQDALRAGSGEQHQSEKEKRG